MNYNNQHHRSKKSHDSLNILIFKIGFFMRNFISNTLLIISCFLVNGGYAGATVTDCTGVPDYSQSCSPSNGSCDTGTCAQGACYCGYSNDCKDNNMTKDDTCQYIVNGKVYNNGTCNQNLNCYGPPRPPLPLHGFY